MEKEISEELLKSEENERLPDEEGRVSNKYIPSRQKSFVHNVRKSRYHRLSKEDRVGGKSKSCCLCCVASQDQSLEESHPVKSLDGEQETSVVSGRDSVANDHQKDARLQVEKREGEDSCDGDAPVGNGNKATVVQTSNTDQGQILRRTRFYFLGFRCCLLLFIIIMHIN